MPWYVAWAPTPPNGRLGEVYIGPNSNIAVGKQFCSFLRRTGQVHLTVRWCTRHATCTSRWSFRRWRTGQPMLACRILAITFSSELRFRWSCTFWKAYEILYIPELKPYQFEQIGHSEQSGVHRASYMVLQFFQQFRLRIVGITFSSELRFWWSWTFWKAYKINYISELKPCQFE